MNLQQLGIGSVSIGYFFLTAALLLGSAVLLSYIVKPLEVQLQQNLQEIAEDLGEEVDTM